MAGMRLEANFHIITGHIAAAKNIKKCVDKAGLEVDEMILEPLASSVKAVLSNKGSGVIMVDRWWYCLITIFHRKYGPYCHNTIWECDF